MADVEISYKGEIIATMNASGTKTLETSGKYCEDDIEISYSKSGGGSGSNSPVCSTQITIPEGGSTSFNVTLSKTVEKCIVWVCADNTTLASMLADTTTQYYIPSIFQMYPVVLLDNVSTRALNSMMQRFRGSSGSYAVSQIDCVSISGTTLTVSFVSSQGKLFPGTYNVIVWEVSDT